MHVHTKPRGKLTVLSKFSFNQHHAKVKGEFRKVAQEVDRRQAAQIYNSMIRD